MSSKKFFMPLVSLVGLIGLVAMACGAAATPTPIVIEKEVIKGVEVIKEVEVIKVVVATPTPTPEVTGPARVGRFVVASVVLRNRVPIVDSGASRPASADKRCIQPNNERNRSIDRSHAPRNIHSEIDVVRSKISISCRYRRCTSCSSWLS